MNHQIFILDDSIDRFNLFTRVIGNVYNYCYSAENMLSLIREAKITAELLLLDHDLGPTVMDGTTLVSLLKKENLALPTVKRIIIHSNNTSKNVSMALSLKDIYPDKIIKVMPISMIHDLWNKKNRNKEEVLQFLLSIK